MIVIVGTSHDDILYYDKILYNRRTETVFKRFEIAIGTVFNQEVCVVSDLYSSPLSSAVMTYILDKYYVDLVIGVGKCIGVDKSAKNGDIVISSRVIDTNVDLTRVRDVSLGQIPGMNKEYKVQTDIINYLSQSVSKRPYTTSYQAVYLSSDNLSEETFKMLSTRRSLFGITNEKIVVDHNSSGLALACSLRDIPYAAIKVVENRIEQDDDINTYLKVLDKYIDLGKSVVSTIGDIGRNDILRGGVGSAYKKIN